MDWRTQHSKDVRSPQIDTQVFKEIPIKIAARFFVDVDKFSLKLCGQTQALE